MPRLDAKARAKLPDTAFAYVDSLGRRRLPINDESHVRNALSRFEQTVFESESARDRARIRLLRAAKRYGIVPIGFIGGQVTRVRDRAEVEARASEVRALPTGVVTFLLADIENSTRLVQQLGDGYGTFLAAVRRLQRATIRDSEGRPVDVRADELFAVFKEARAALNAAIAIQRKVLVRTWPRGAQVRIRMGVHTGRPALTDSGYVGLAVHLAARVCSAAHGGQILMSRATRDALAGAQPSGVSFRDLGSYQLQGMPGPEPLFQADAAGLPSDFPPPRTSAGPVEVVRT